MNILVIGGTGLIGSSVVRKLHEAGHQVTVFSRGNQGRAQAHHPGIEYLVGDRTVASSLEGAVHGRVFDTVFDLVAMLPEESGTAVRIFKGKVGRYIHCSTVSVYMVSDRIECPITEDQDKAPVMDFWDRNPFGMDYGLRKRECEDVLWKAHDEQDFPVSMLRPTYVSGPRDPAKRDFFWIERILDGRPLLVPGTGNFAFQQVFVEDVARAFVSLLDHPSSIGKAYNVASEEVYTLNGYLTMLADMVERNPEITHVKQEEFDDLPFSRHPAGDVFTFNVRRTAVFSLERVKADLQYTSTPFRTWMPQTISWFTSREGEHSLGYERRHEEVEFARKWKSQHEGASRERHP